MNMEMGSTTTVMAGISTTTVPGAAETTASAKHMSMGGCKISMLWNWNTVDACFLSKEWHIRSTTMFAGTCIGVVMLVMSLEALRRSAREYDIYIIKQHMQVQSAATMYDSSSGEGERIPLGNISGGSLGGVVAASTTFRPSALQQAMRATLHMAQFAIAYLIMLLAMYYNGYILLCIAIGAWIGAYICTWQQVSVSGPVKEATLCCG